MAQRNLRAAADAAERHPERARELGVDAEEARGWRDAARAMFVPFDDELGVHPQAEGFTDHEVWDFEHTPPDDYPLFLHYPYFELYRKQVVKQADLVLALHCAATRSRRGEGAQLRLLRGADGARLVAVGLHAGGHRRRDRAPRARLDYFAEAALIDLQDLEHNTRDGLHIASLAGAWIAAVAGFGGMRDHEGG